MRLSNPPLITEQQIQRRVAEMAQEITADFAERLGGGDLLLIAVLKGGLMFTADLMRRLTVPVLLDFIGARSYQNTESLGHVEWTHLPEQTIAGAHVLVVEDILDTGRTVTAILDRLRSEDPASVALCTLLDKPSRRVAPVEADYVGFTIDDHFVVGYGLDYEQRGRHLPDLYILEQP